MTINAKFLNTALLAWFSIAAAHAQGLSAHFDKQALRMEGESLSVHLENLDATIRWVFAVRISPNTGPHFAAGSGPLNPQPHAMPVTSFAQLSNAVITTGNGSMTVNMAGRTREAMLLYVELPSPAAVALDVNGMPMLTDFAVSHSLLVKNGEVLANEVKTFRDVTRALFFPPQVSAPPIRRLPNGEVFVAKDELRAHLINQTSIPSASYHPRVPKAVLTLAISEAGVPRVLSVSGDQKVASLAAKMIEGWQFTPFQLDGQVVPVKSGALFLMEPQGEVRVVW